MTCFAGTSFAALPRAVLAVADWDGADDTEPAGWLKNGQTKELRRGASGTGRDPGRSHFDSARPG